MDTKKLTLGELTGEDFIRELASGHPTPGGGSASALAGALAAALAAMVGRLTVGREKYRPAWETMERTITQADALAARLITLMEEDSAAYQAIMAARGRPKDDPTRAAAIEVATRRATEVPLATLEAAAQAAELAMVAVDHGNPNGLTDAAVGAALARAAGYGAAANVLVNLPGVDDPDWAADLRARVAATLGRLLEVDAYCESRVKTQLGR